MSSLPQLLAITRRVLPWLAVAALVGFHAWLHTVNFTPAYMEVDPDGYLTLAKRMAMGGPIAVKDNDPFIHQTHVWVENPRGEVAPKFNVGYPLLLAAAWRLGGDTAMFWVSPVMGGLALIGAFLLFRQWMSTSLSLIALALLTVNGTYQFYSGYLLTHTADLCMTVWGMYFLFEFIRRPGAGQAIGTGFCLGFAGAIRHTSLLLAIPVLITAMAKWISPGAGMQDPFAVSPSQDSPPTAPETPTRRSLYRPLAVLLVAYAVFPLLLAIYHWHVFGSPMTTGYALSGEQGAFAWGFFKRDFEFLNHGLMRDGFYLLYPIGLVGMLLIGPWLQRGIACSWFVPLYLVYGSYYWKNGSLAYFRFFINVLPLLLGMTFALIDRARAPRSARLAAALVLAAFIFIGNLHFLQNACRGKMNAGWREMAEAARSIRMQPDLPKDAVIFTREPFHAYIGTLADYHLYDLRAFTDIRADFQDPPPVDYRRYYEEVPRRQPARTARFREFYSTHNADQLRQMKRDTIRFWMRQGKPVIFLLPNPELQFQRNELADEFCLSSLGTITLFRQPWNLAQILPDTGPAESAR
jgi:hypothetical protein